MERILLRGALVAAAATLGFPSLAQAHFHLNAPDSWLVQETDGTPQKTAPCGDPSESQPAAQMSNKITEYKAGETIAVKLNETVTHPGHYRVALSLTGQDGLPDDPMVTKSATDTSANGQCGTAEVMDPPMMPILVDGALDHTTKFSGEQTIMVTLPTGISCEKCTLQVVEFMSNHPAPCFYHHCADIKITNDGGMSSGGAGGMSSGGMSAGGASSGGMSAGGASAGGASSGGMSSGGAAGMSTMGGASGTTGQGGGAGTATAGSATSAGTGGTGGGGMTAAGGTGNTATGGTGNTTATGGTGNTTTGAGGTQAGTGTAPPTAAKETDEEGGCRVAPGRTSSPVALLALLGLAGILARRRR